MGDGGSRIPHDVVVRKLGEVLACEDERPGVVPAGQSRCDLFLLAFAAAHIVSPVSERPVSVAALTSG